MLSILPLICLFALKAVLAQDGCTDIQPTANFTCAEQKTFGKCSDRWLVDGNFCSKTCDRCEEDFACGQEGSCVYNVCEKARCAEGNCNARRSNIQGEVLILDYNSLSYHGGPNHPPAVTNPAGCCDKCKATQGCNSWVFCSNRDGCGQGCDLYAQALADLESGYLSFARGNIAPVPFTNFGQFGGCQGSKWPWLLCTLKVVPDVEDPVEEKSTAGEVTEWVSGVLKPEPGCVEDISYAVCSSCKGTTDMTYCQQCAATVPLNEQLLCPVCTDRLDTTALQKHCTECLGANGGSSKGCGQCATLTSSVQECFECTADADDVETENGCCSCFDQTSEVEGCVQDCVKAPATPIYAKPECGDCYTTEDPVRCTQCLQESKEADSYCPSCSTDECYTCLSLFGNNGAGRKGCANCAFNDGEAATDCYECVQDENTPGFAKQACGECSSSETSDSRKACYGCLQSIQSEEAGSSCSMCENMDDSSRCYECVGRLSGRGSNGGACWQCASQDSILDQTACYACAEDSSKPVEVAEMCHMCFGSWVADSKACTACMATKTTAEETSECY
eukprot:TRINITY_DN504_c0_g1_i1.p1 TRINITY_DN504_c0_g1~~TRINITY_DN504_c0_g1_i1.p1  ORF type:complete len:563 (+),score=114.64 TRINITY_DN504_c0_g1_i1:1433-3121(+)